MIQEVQSFVGQSFVGLTIRQMVDKNGSFGARFSSKKSFVDALAVRGSRSFANVVVGKNG